MVLDLEHEKLIHELVRSKPKKVLVQLPEGIKQHAFEILKKIESLGIEVIFSGDTCWGGCSVNPIEAKALGADLLIHYGHAPFIKTKFPTLYMEIKDTLELGSLLEKSVSLLKPYKRISLSYSVQHKQDIDRIVSFFSSHGKEVVLSQKKGFAAYPGHVIGCEYSGLKTVQERVDAFVILGNNFHAMGAILAVSKPVILLDVYNDKVTEMKGVREKILLQRISSIEKLKKAKRIGIIIETKEGQKFGSASVLKEKFEKAGKEVVVLTMNEITPDKLFNFYTVEAFVELACPRIAIDDYAKYSRPLLTYKEALVALGEKSLEQALKEGLL